MQRPRKDPTQAQVANYMRASLRNGEHRNPRRRCEVNSTSLAEDAAYAFGHDEWLDDELHFVWELAVDIPDELADELDIDRP